MPGEVSQTPVEVNSQSSLAEKVSPQGETFRSKLKATKIGQKVSRWWRRKRGRFAQSEIPPGGPTHAFLQIMGGGSEPAKGQEPGDSTVGNKEVGRDISIGEERSDDLDELSERYTKGFTDAVKSGSWEKAQKASPKEMTSDDKVSRIHDLFEEEQKSGGGPLTVVLERMMKVYDRDPYTQVVKHLKIEDGPKSELEWNAVALKSSEEGLVDFLGDISSFKSSNEIINALTARVNSLTSEVASGKDAKELYKSSDDSRRALRGIQFALRDLSRSNPDQKMAAQQLQASKDLLRFRKDARLTFWRQLQDTAPLMVAAAVEGLAA